MNSFRNPKPIQSGKAKVSLSTVPTISKGSQHNNTIAIPTCSGIMFQEGSFSDSLIAEPVIGTTNLGRSRNSKNRLGTSSTSSALPSVRVSQNVNEAFGQVQNCSRVPIADYSSVGALGSVEDDVPIGPSVSAVRPSVTIPALSRDSSLGLTATPFRVTTPSRSTPDIASAISQAVLRTATWLRQWISLLLLKKGRGKLSRVSLDPLAMVATMFGPLAKTPGLHIMNVIMSRTRLCQRVH